VSPQKYWNKIYRIAGGAVVLLTFAGVGFAFLPKVTQFYRYQETKSGLEADIRTKEEAIKELRRMQEKFGTDKYFVQKLAHEIGYAHESETIFQFNDSRSNNILENMND